MTSAYRYLRTYAVLLQHFAGSRGWRFGLMLGAVLLSAVLHPVPFLLLAELLRGAQAGTSDIALGWRAFSLHLRPDLGVLLVFLAGAGSYLFSFAVGRLVNAETIAWQGRIFWQLLGEIGQIARWDRSLDLGIVLRPLTLSIRIESALRGAFPIGRLVETGARDAIMVAVLFSILVWQDARDMAVLAFISLLFVPAYATALARLVRMQAKSNAGLTRLRQPVIDLLSGELVRRPGRRLDTGAVSSQTVEAISHGYGSQSYLLNEQNAVTAVAGLHVFASFYGVYLSEGRSLMALPVAKLSFFFFLVLMLRSLIGLVGLMSRLSRGYERLGLMRSLLFPARKAIDPGRAGSGITFLVAAGRDDADAASMSILSAGEILLFLAPDTSFSYQLLPLANALQPQFIPPAGLVRHIPLLGAADMPALRAGSTIEGDAGSLRLPPAGVVAFRPDPIVLAKAPVVALTLEAWRRLVAEDAVAEANAARILVIAITGRVIPSGLPVTALAALSDGRALTACGRQPAMLAELARTSKATVTQPLPAGDEDETEGSV